MTMLTALKDSYTSWLLANIEFKEIDSQTIRIDTPFLDNDFDNIILYVDILPRNQLMISDDGYTLSNLKSLGYEINNRTSKRMSVLKDIVDNYGIEYDVNTRELFIKTDLDKFPVSKHRLLQAILKINDIFMLRPNYEPNANFETVSKKLTDHDILFSEKYPAIGKGGISFIFDFSIPTKQRKDKLVRLINSPNDLNYSKVLSMDASMLKDTKDADFFVILDDVNHDLKSLTEIEAIYDEVREKNDIKISTIMMSELEKQLDLLKN